MPHKISRMSTKLALMITILLGGCAQVEFDATLAGAGQAIRVGNSQDVQFSATPLNYRMQAVESHLVFWIENPTSEPVELIGDKSTVIDPEGIAHPLHGEMIAPNSSIKEVLPPLAEPADTGAPSSPDAASPYDRPGFISVPGALTNSDKIDPIWQWNDELEVQLNLVFEQNGHQFEQHFSFRRVRK
jgi:hypothetical protein